MDKTGGVVHNPRRRWKRVAEVWEVPFKGGRSPTLLLGEPRVVC